MNSLAEEVISDPINNKNNCGHIRSDEEWQNHSPLEGPTTSDNDNNNSSNEQTTKLHRQISISEAANLASESTAPWFVRWFEIPFHIRGVDGIYLPEACGWAMDSAARGPLNQFGGFIGSAILRMATIDAGCKTTRDCDIAIKGGFKPSSLLTLMSTVVGITVALIMPFVGSMVDHTRYRKHIGVVSAILCTGLAGVELVLSVEKNNWFFVLIVDAIQSFFLLIHTSSVFAYLPDLTTDEAVLPHYTSQFYVRQYGAQIIFTLLLIMSGGVRGNNRSVESSVFTARVAAGMAFGYGCLFFGYAWTFLFKQRPALSKVQEGQTLCNAGFVQIGKTSRKIWHNYKALKWFQFSLLWSPDAGAGVVLAIVVSFLTIEMEFNGQNLAYMTIALMLGVICGSFFSKFLCKRINPLNTYRSGLLALSGVLGVAVAYLDDPDKRNVCYGFGVFLGFCSGWIYPSQRVLYCTLIPKGQESEMMGIFSFTSQILGWIPPLIVTIMNENGIKLRFGLLVIPGFCTLAVICTLLMGNYADATALVARDSKTKLQEVLRATNPALSVTGEIGPKIDDGSSNGEKRSFAMENRDAQA